MSRALAKSERRPLDAYYTPDSLARALVGLLPIPESATVLEPHVGGGAFARALFAKRLGWLTLRDIDPAAPGLTEWANTANVGDFLDATGEYDWIIGNPPFGGFEAHVDHALELAPNVAFLLRTSVMSSQGRIPCWERWPLRHVWVLAERPSFTDDGKVDRYDYSFFWFQRSCTGLSAIKPGWSWR